MAHINSPKALKALTDMIPIPSHHPKGLALHPGYPIYRPTGEPVGTTQSGDRIVYVEPITPGPARLPIPHTCTQEWVQGMLADSDGPWCTQWGLASIGGGRASSVRCPAPGSLPGGDSHALR